MTSPSPIVQFYQEQGTDHRSRRLTEIHAWPDSSLERIHDYIQWLFPLPEPSNFNASAPLLDAETVQAFRDSPALQAKLRASFLRMLQFYGLALNESAESPKVAESSNFSERAAEWRQPGNHNYLRLTRILRCLRLLGLEAEAQALFAWLRDAYEAERHQARPAIPESTFRYWREAMEMPLSTHG